ncbi:valine--tRNA ligase [Altererythrobacter indicus]|uniref:Valine--tRNA ligase n=1 Tax=Altericroceibacterium indicum TaxID=374177 RepID=A0A845A9R4_9SPHN|nr:valine--tRNA ligase [Altericroceibacterium indicum]MXP25751.1 valine--tRNA ligase [Altericroceibacterium indicum]
MTSQLDTTFDPASIETRWYTHWEENGLFRPERPDATPFTIVNPPPNVTGSLHIGHALDNTLQDIVIRYERLKGKDALWVVGTDHAGIATQMVVERNLESQGIKRAEIGREAFLKHVWEWKEQSGGTITRQMRRLGCSMDWSREQFTMDEHFSKAVIKVFVDLYNKGLIYRDKRLVNWDPKLKTAISDLEVETRDVKSGFWHFKYPLADGVTLDDGRNYIEVATTRPETMLADMAVAVHPEDERYASVIGKEILQPITGRRFKIVADEHADPELGSGAVKITPGHDFNDFDVGKRAGIKPADMLNMLDAEACVVQTADGLVPEEFLGLDRFDARKLVVERMKEAGFLIPHITKNKDGEEELHDAEPRTVATPFGDRGGVVIEPWLTDQWYVDAETLAQPPMQAVRDGRIEIVPKTWEKTFFNWMENIQPWCVSRQLWWGHQIPAWFTEDGEVFVAETEEEAYALYRHSEQANRHSRAGGNPADTAEMDSHLRGNDEGKLTRDSDVLDTWFSSALWPFGTLGWPDDTELVRKHYPNDLLISGFDILFFWDARMAMQGMEFMGEVPWKRLYLHGLVRAADGQKMSKSKGNVVDPLTLIDQYGADALRFFMASMESQGRDVKMDERRVEGYRNFATKLWNATRFCQSNGITASSSVAAPEAKLAANQWIIGEVVKTAEALDKAMADLRFDAAANTIYQFTWATFCDWYLELIKPVFQGDPDAMPAKETRAVAGWALDQILVMLHPFMPFITEELWHAQGEREYELILAKWPAPEAQVDQSAIDAIDWVIQLTTAVRAAKNELGISPGAKLAAFCPEPSDLAKSVMERSAAAVERLARLTPVEFGDAPAGAAMQIAAGTDAFIIPLDGVIDVEAEKARLTKAKAAAEKERDSLAKRLDNPKFVEKAKPEAVEKARADYDQHNAEALRLEAALTRLG